VVVCVGNILLFWGIVIDAEAKIFSAVESKNVHPLMGFLFSLFSPFTSLSV
jgi:hypothetical protein